MAQVISLRALGVLWLGLFALVAIAAPMHVMELNLLSLALALAVAGFLFPGVTLGIGIATLVLAPDHFQFVDRYVQAHLTFLGVHTIQKIVLLASFVPAILRYGPRWAFNPAILAVVALYVFSILFSSRYPGLTQAQIAKTFIALLMPFLLFHLKIHKRWIEPSLVMIACLPIIAVLLGYVAEFSGVREAIDGGPWKVVFEEYTGAWRLQGVTIPAYLAFHAYTAFFVSLYQAIIYRKKFYYVLGGLAFAAIVLSGTRTPIVCAILFAGFAVLFASPRDLRGSSKFVISVVGATLVGALLAIYWPSLEARFLEGYNEAGFNTSGRAAAWDYMVSAFSVNPVFGRGIGTNVIMFLEDIPHSQIDAAHNEFLRLLVDSGVVGLIIYLACLVSLFMREARVLDRGQGFLIFGILLSFAAYSFTDNTISAPPSLVFFFALTILLAKARLERSGLSVG